MNRIEISVKRKTSTSKLKPLRLLKVQRRRSRYKKLNRQPLRNKEGTPIPNHRSGLSELKITKYISKDKMSPEKLID